MKPTRIVTARGLRAWHLAWLLGALLAGGLLPGCGGQGARATRAGDTTPAASSPVQPAAVAPAPVPPTPAPEASAPLASAPASAPHAHDHAVTSSEGRYRVFFSCDPAAIPLNEVFDLAVRVTDAHGAPIRGVRFEIDARMPDHRHGMLRAPRVVPEAEGCFAVSGMLFHMPGRWEIHFDLTTRGVTERAQWEVELE